MNLFVSAKLELQGIAGFLLMKQKGMVFHMRNFVNTNGIWPNRIGISILNRKVKKVKICISGCMTEW